MGLLDNAKKLAAKAQDVAADHKDQVKAGLEKAEGLVDKATGGKHTGKIQAAGDKAEGFVDKLESD